MRHNTIGIPIPCLFDPTVSTTAKVIYLVLKSFPKDKSSTSNEKIVTVSHSEIIGKSGLSQKTVVKALKNLESTGWIQKINEMGRKNKYILHAKHLTAVRANTIIDTVQTR